MSHQPAGEVCGTKWIFTKCKRLFQCLIAGLASKSPENLDKHPVSLHDPRFGLSTSSVALVTLRGIAQEQPPPQSARQRCRGSCRTCMPLACASTNENHIPVYGRSPSLLVTVTMAARQPWWPQSCLDSKDPGDS